jgi:hypothetical protein
VLLIEPLAGYGVVFRVKLDAEIGAPEHLGGQQGRAGIAGNIKWRNLATLFGVIFLHG